MSTALVAYGSNVGDSRKLYRDAQAILASETDHVELIRASQAIETVSIGGRGDQADTNPSENPKGNKAGSSGRSMYLNGALRIRTTLTAQELLKQLQRIEHQLGRVRDRRWGPRTVDLDLLLFDEQIIEETELICPHPRMSFRRFVLEPSADIAAEMFHPTAQLTIGQLLSRLNDRPRLVIWLGSSNTDQLRRIVENQTPLKQTLTIVQPGQWPVAAHETMLNRFWICQVTNAEQFQTLQNHAMLLIKPIGVEMDESLVRCSAKFCGARLLVDSSQPNMKTELHAAIDAML